MTPDGEMRKYSVTELEKLRRAIKNKWLWGRYHGGEGCSRSFKENEMYECVEALVRTHMLAGHTAEDLYASEKKTKDEHVIMIKENQ